ncbi:hypothetical protein B0H11DRAFT_2194267 [Mycena galericulata]|nr:hypothetical protein B0H11DRAFT_2194267 [Mycena galericulata]
MYHTRDFPKRCLYNKVDRLLRWRGNHRTILMLSSLAHLLNVDPIPPARFFVRLGHPTHTRTAHSSSHSLLWQRPSRWFRCEIMFDGVGSLLVVAFSENIEQSSRRQNRKTKPAQSTEQILPFKESTLFGWPGNEYVLPEEADSSTSFMRDAHFDVTTKRKSRAWIEHHMLSHMRDALSAVNRKDGGPRVQDESITSPIETLVQSSASKMTKYQHYGLLYDTSAGKLQLSQSPVSKEFKEDQQALMYCVVHSASDRYRPSIMCPEKQFKGRCIQCVLSAIERAWILVPWLASQAGFISPWATVMGQRR